MGLLRSASRWATTPPAESPPGADELVGVSIDTTSVCNLRCTICSLDEHYAGKGVMSLETFRRVLVDAPRIRHMAFSSSAEPLLNPHLAEMIGLAKAASGGRVVASFTTNGTLLDERRANELFEQGLDALEISLDGAAKETFEAIRLGSRFERVMANVARIPALKRRFGRTHPHVSIRFTLLRDNQDDLPAMVELAHRLEIDHLVVNGLEPYTPEMAEKILYGPRGNPGLAALFEELEARCADYGMRIDLPSPVPDRIDDCRLTDHSCILLWDGTVVPCSPVAYPRTYYFFGERQEHPRIAFGNVRERTLLGIWASEEYATFRRNVRNGVLYDCCKTCLKRAGVICPLRHWKWLSAGAPAARTSAPPR